MKFLIYILSVLLLASCSSDQDIDARLIPLERPDSLEVVEQTESWWGSAVASAKELVSESKIYVAPPEEDENLEGQKFVGVMVENSTISRQGMQGLSEAKVVYEALAEGGITRFLAIFSEPAEDFAVGPIRSARDYFLDWAEEFSLRFVHVGGSDSVMDRIAQGANIIDIDEYGDEDLFFRDNRYVKPHNAFAEIKDLFYKGDNDLVNQKDFIFTKDDVVLDKRNTGLSINFGHENYHVDYVYDEQFQTYLRSNGGKPHIDHLNEKQIGVKNILIQEVSFNVVDDKLRLDMDTTTGGKCVFMTQGTHQACEWSHDGEFTRYQIGGEDVQFNKGNLWIEVVGGFATYEIDEKLEELLEESE